jgi:hypothetical protein
MSDFRAIATVTATLQRTLQEAVQADLDGATVSTVRPAEGESTGLPGTGVNIFLYQVSHNPHWRNEDLPTRAASGTVTRRPTAAVDLHYLFSFYGGEAELEPQRLLGSALAFLHSQPLLTRAQIDAAVTDAAFLAGSDLSEQIDLVRFTPLSLSLEDLSRLWSVFFQIKYVLSTAFRASVVLVQPQVEPATLLPARTYELTAMPLRRPRIRRVLAAVGEDAPIVAGGAVRLEGELLGAEALRVEIDGVEATVSEAGDNVLVFTPAVDTAAGAHNVQVRHGTTFGAPGALHLVFASNVASFVLQPSITGTPVIGDVVGTGTAPRSAIVDVVAEPPVRRRQVVTLELLREDTVRHTFAAEPRTADSTALRFQIDGVAAGAYRLRLRVDGAGSAPTPEVTIP